MVCAYIYSGDCVRTHEHDKRDTNADTFTRSHAGTLRRGQLARACVLHAPATLAKAARMGGSHRVLSLSMVRLAREVRNVPSDVEEAVLPRSQNIAS